MNRIVCQFSCGAASAVATKLAIAQYGATREVVIVNAFIKEEHEDNRRFLADCEQWFERPITVLRADKYNASTDEVWMKRRYMKGQHGAPCSQELKRRLLDTWRKPGDTIVLGFTAEETDRLDAFIDNYNHVPMVAPLIENGLGRADCFAMVERAGIELPAMYRLGYHNANCIGCPKGGEGYWNKIRRDFPERFERVAQIQELIGPGTFFFRNRKTKERYGLRDLKPNAGRYQTEPKSECGVLCFGAETTIRDAAA
jgi:hypothetical protein